MPNRAAFSFGVTTQAKSAAGALNGNNAEMRKVIAAIKRAGIAARDVQTSSVSLSPRYSQNGEDIVGYTASNTVNADHQEHRRARERSSTQPWARGRTRSTARRSRVSDETVLYRRALAAAVANARGKAQTLAGAGKVRLGRRALDRRVLVRPGSDRGEGGGTDVGTPIEPGTQRIEASVTVEFALR